MKKVIIVDHIIDTQRLATEIAKHHEAIIIEPKSLNEIIEEETSYKITNPRKIDFQDETSFRIVDSSVRNVIPPKFYKRKK